MESQTKKKNNRFKHLSIEKRILLKQYLEQGFSKVYIAKLLGVHHSTIYRELKRGFLNGEYSPIFAANDYEKQSINKSKNALLIKDKDLAVKIADLILNEKLSPSLVIKRLKELGYNKPSSPQTIYSAIDKGLIPNVTRNDLKVEYTKLFSKGLIQIPKWIRNELNLKDGDTVHIKIENNKILIE